MGSEDRSSARVSVRHVGEVAEQLRQIAVEADRRGQPVPMPPAAVAQIAAWMLTTAQGSMPVADTSVARAIAAALPELAPPK